MARKPKYSEQAIDEAIDGIGAIVDKLSERDIEVTSLIAGLAIRVDALEKLVETLTASANKP